MQVQTIKTTILKNPLIIRIHNDHVPLCGVTKIDYDILTKQYVFWLGESRKVIGYEGYTILGVYNNN